jgi:hypothetical protein
MSRYTPTPAPGGDLRRWLEDELARIRSALDALYDGEMETQRIDPTNPTFGTIVVAEPGGWDPGSGPGAYCFEGTTTASAAWVKL